jgi:transposase InsO family protein
MATLPQILEFIKALRTDHPRLGKEKIKPLLDEYCLGQGIPSIKESTIGKVIKRKNYFFQKQGKIYHNPASKWNQKAKVKRLRVKHPPSHLTNGHIQSDTVLRITNGIKDYFYSAIDTRMKFSLTLNYLTLNSRNNKDFYLKFKSCYPGDIKDWQSDNGLENLGEFDDQLERDGIPHLFTYPRCPKINGVVERYNRTLQEEFI